MKAWKHTFSLKLASQNCFIVALRSPSHKCWVGLLSSFAISMSFSFGVVKIPLEKIFNLGQLIIVTTTSDGKSRVHFIRDFLLTPLGYFTDTRRMRACINFFQKIYCHSPHILIPLHSPLLTPHFATINFTFLHFSA